MNTPVDVIVARDGTMTGDQRVIDELVELAKSKREAAHAATIAFNLGVTSERKRCMRIAEEIGSDIYYANVVYDTACRDIAAKIKAGK